MTSTYLNTAEQWYRFDNTETMLPGENMKLFNKEAGAKEARLPTDAAVLPTVWIVYAYQKR